MILIGPATKTLYIYTYTLHLGGTIQYPADPIRITIHDTQSVTYHDTLLFSKNLLNYIKHLLSSKQNINFFLAGAS